MTPVNMTCKQRRLGDSIYEYNSDRPTSSCQYFDVKAIKMRLNKTDNLQQTANTYTRQIFVVHKILLV